MIQRTYGQVKAFLAEYAMNNGLAVDDTRLLGYVNRAQRELANEGEWPGLVDQWYFRTDPLEDALLTVPSKFERVLGVTLDGVPKEIRSPWFEFCRYGTGSMYNNELDSYGNAVSARVNWTDILVDRGESVTRTELPVDGGPWKLRVYASIDEDTGGVSPELLVRGTDENGEEIRSGVIAGSTIASYISGEYIAIDYAAVGGYSESINEYSGLKSVLKPVTRRGVRLTAWNGVTEVELSRYDWDETNPTYRRYFMPDLFKDKNGERDSIVRARCRLKVPTIADDSDVMVIGNEVALCEMMIAQYKRQVNDGEAYLMHKQTAIDLMNKEATAYLGKTKTPAITFTKGFGLMDGLPLIR